MRVLTRGGSFYALSVVSKKSSRCAVARGEVDVDAYSRRDAEWRELGLASPARRALVDAGLTRVSQLSKRKRAAIAELHGMGPNALKKIDIAMSKRGLKFLE